MRRRVGRFAFRKGMIYSPSHGDTEFTVPLFGEFMLRVTPTAQFERRKHKRSLEIGVFGLNPAKAEISAKH